MPSNHRKSPLFSALVFAHPMLFEAKNPLPLAVGVREEILAAHPGTDERKLHRLLSWWTGRPSYLRRMTEGAVRHGLSETRSEVTAEQAEFARKTLDKIAVNAKPPAAIQRAAIAKTPEGKQRADTINPSVSVRRVEVGKPTAEVERAEAVEPPKGVERADTVETTVATQRAEKPQTTEAEDRAGKMKPPITTERAVIDEPPAKRKRPVLSLRPKDAA